MSQSYEGRLAASVSVDLRTVDPTPGNPSTETDALTPEEASARALTALALSWRGGRLQPGVPLLLSLIHI